MSFNRYIKAAWPFICLIYFIGCAKKKSSEIEDQDRILLTLYAVYSSQKSSEGELTITARFKFEGEAGSPVELDQNAGIWVGQDKMQKHTGAFNQVWYEWKRKLTSREQREDEYIITYVNNLGKNFINHFKLPREVDPFIGGASSDINFPLKVDWSCESNLDGDDIEIQLFKDENEQYELAKKNYGFHGLVLIDALKLGQMGVGAITYRACRINEVEQTQFPAIGGSLRLRRCSLIKHHNLY